MRQRDDVLGSGNLVAEVDDCFVKFGGHNYGFGLRMVDDESDFFWV